MQTIGWCGRMMISGNTALSDLTLGHLDMRQIPARIKHLDVVYKKAIRVRITEVPSDVHRLFEMCKAAGVPYRGEGVAYVAQNIFLRSLKNAAEKIYI